MFNNLLLLHMKIEIKMDDSIQKIINEFETLRYNMIIMGVIYIFTPLYLYCCFLIIKYLFEKFIEYMFLLFDFIVKVYNSYKKVSDITNDIKK